MAKHDVLKDGDVTPTYDALVLANFNRLNMVACDPNRSYDQQAYESGIDDAWYSIPKAKKKGYESKWSAIEEEFPRWKPGERHEIIERNAVLRCQRKRQLLTDVLYGMGVLVSPPSDRDRFLANLEAAGGDK